jgi:hypothetical protein
MCNPAAERWGAKSESEFREAKVKCTQSPPLVWFYWLNAFQIFFLNVDSESFVYAGICFDLWKRTIGTADGCLIRYNPMPRDVALGLAIFLWEDKRCYSCVKQHSQTRVASERSRPVGIKSKRLAGHFAGVIFAIGPVLAAEVLPLQRVMRSAKRLVLPKEFGLPNMRVFCNRMRVAARLHGIQSRGALSGIKESWLAWAFALPKRIKKE